MFDDDPSVVYVNIDPSPPLPKQRPRSKVKNMLAATSGHAQRKRRAAPSLQDRLKPIDPISARLPYRGPPHY